MRSIFVVSFMTSHTYKLGDKVFLQNNDGGPIGLEATGAIARTVMMLYDAIYKEKVKSEGIKLLLYERYIDDIGQAVRGESGCETEEDIAARLKVIANNILEGIEVEETLPSRHEDKKLPILDMKVYLDKDGYIVYEHYEKEVSSKLVISERSAHSTSGKRSVHMSEMIRRMLNTSRRLEWNTFTAPVLQNYIERMMAGTEKTTGLAS